MTVLGIDLGATKLSLAVFTEQGDIVLKRTIALEKRKGGDVGSLIVEEAHKSMRSHQDVQAIGIAVPGIYYHDTGRVWAPNIDGWDDYPLLDQMKTTTNVPVHIDSDRAAYILGESWFGNAKGCRNAIYLAVGTGIGAGILVDGRVLRGQRDIAGAIGWMALKQPFEQKYVACGCFEYHASGEGIPRVAREVLAQTKDYKGPLSVKRNSEIKAADVFAAYSEGDIVAREVFTICIRFWGMAIANLVSLFNPEKIVLGGGVFGPAVKFIPDIIEEAAKWAQPVSIRQTAIEPSSLGTNAGLYGAGLMAWQCVRNSAMFSN